MTLAAPTSALFKARYPAFGAVDDGVVALVLGEATNEVDETWNGPDQVPAMLCFAAHLLVQQGLGSDTATIGGISYPVLGPMESIKEGDTSLSFSQATRPRLTLTGDSTDLAYTVYGRRFLELRQRNVPSVAVCAGLPGCGPGLPGLPSAGVVTPQPTGTGPVGQDGFPFDPYNPYPFLGL